MLVILEQQPSMSSFCFFPAVFLYFHFTDVFHYICFIFWYSIFKYQGFFFLPLIKVEDGIEHQSCSETASCYNYFSNFRGLSVSPYPWRNKKKYRPAFMGATQIVHVTKVWPLFAHLYLCIYKKKSCCLSITSVVLQSHAAPLKCPDNHGVCLHGADSVRGLAPLHQTDPCL